MMQRSLLPVLAALVLASCSEVLGPEPDIPDHSVPLDALPVYAHWWSEVEAASGLRRGPDRVQWFLVRGGLFFSQRDRVMSSGRWISDGRIYLAEGWERDEANVKHEMLHELLRGDHEHAHPLFDKYDVRSCWSLVTTWEPCSEVPDGY